MTTDVNKQLRIKKQAEFLAAYAAVGNISTAAKLTGIQRSNHYNWLRESQDYHDKFEDASEQAIDSLESEARRRAVDGVDRPVFHKGEQVGAVREYSDTLLIFLLKGLRPEKYRERSSQEITATGAQAVEIRVVTDDNFFGNDAHEKARKLATAVETQAITHSGDDQNGS